MTTQLIPVFNGNISDETTQLCNARDLHKFLCVGKRFASWITERIAEYGFVQNQDYVIASQNREAKSRGGHNRKDYHLTLDTAKELSMVERNEKGRQIRRYFIECEKQLRQKDHQPLSTEETYTLNITGSELCSLCWVWSVAEYMREKIELVYPALRTLNSNYAPSFYSMASEYKRTLEVGRKVLERETRHIKTSASVVEDANWRSVLRRLQATEL
ncbi:antA/AntB antirepressor family protein [Citrobacter sp.]|uniref:antA/AntB antirepressor family protein n=1 Tax=Citrobacter TaxID=544 RepID=UPI001A318749|nr:antA/AntB antirepressor family protein [Citrobacter sp.]EHG7889381.1 AntA/AntB antirepressor [Citrobacter braakii]MDU2844478.1 antA/AntB antirepressor family protein [Citrobacter sp.]HAT7998969.1 AntA/AntB antirepressor [Citrobacter braakii]